MRHPFRIGLVALALLVGGAGCAGAGEYVWVSQLPAQYTTRPPDPSYLIRDGDMLSIRVFNQEAMSTHARVRPDGKIAMPALGDVDARGKKPSALKVELETKLKDYVNAPSVTVTVDETQPIQVTVLGEVAHPGALALDPRATMAQVLAVSGGLTDYASREGIFVVRRGPPPVRVRFTYEGIARGAPTSLGFVLQDGDLVVVE